MRFNGDASKRLSDVGSDCNDASVYVMFFVDFCCDLYIVIYILMVNDVSTTKFIVIIN